VYGQASNKGTKGHSLATLARADRHEDDGAGRASHSSRHWAHPGHENKMRWSLYPSMYRAARLFPRDLPLWPCAVEAHLLRA
jgi:hypothetical protein